MNASLARNKYHTRVILESHGLPNIPYCRPKTLEDAQRFINKHGNVVAKPNSGSGSHDIHIINSLDNFSPKKFSDYIFEKYTPGIEMRYLVLNQRVVAVHESRYGESVSSDRDLERISLPKHEWDDHMAAQSKKIAEIFGLNFIAVDFMIDKSGKSWVLEINTVPGLKWFHSPSSGESVDVAGLFLQAMLEV
jgi:glutathione synthase/RimK-type ligase-like ATP-grasp enzyme